MEIRQGEALDVEGMSLVEVVFSGKLDTGDSEIVRRAGADLAELLNVRNPDAVLLNLVDVPEIFIGDLRSLASVALGPGRPKGSRLCGLTVHMMSVLNPDRTLVHSFEIPGFRMHFGPLRKWAWEDLKAVLEDVALEPPGPRPVYFPDGSLAEDPRFHPFKSEWFSRFLWRMREPSLLDRSRKPDYHGYRFLWLRSFHPPVSVRLELSPDQTARLVTKMTSGTGGFLPGRLVLDETKALMREEVEPFLARLSRAGFWQAGFEDREGLDGAEWVLEGVKEGAYRVVIRWTPMEGAVRDAALFMLRLSGLDVKEIY